MMRVISLVVMAALVVVETRQHLSRLSQMRVELDQVQGNKTMCPYKVEVDENEDRVPRLIKVIKCVPPNEQRPKIPWRQQHRHRCDVLLGSTSLTARCTELYDFAVVYYHSENATSTYEVPVGCTCMLVETETPVNMEDIIERG